MSSPAPGVGRALAARQLSACYGRTMVLRGLSLEVARGELFAIVGPNGAGKSTLLRVLGGTLAPAGGSVELLGRPLNEFSRLEVARRLAVVGAENSVAFNFSVLEVVLMGRAPNLGRLSLEGPRDLGVAREALEHFGLLELAARRIYELSAGERKRVFLARALAQEPAVALFDEPTAFLDLRHVAETFARFRQLCTERATAIVATLHDLNAAALYADRVLLLKQGAAVACGKPQEVFTADNLRHVYETELQIARDPASGTLTVLPLRSDLGRPAS